MSIINKIEVFQLIKRKKQNQPTQLQLTTRDESIYDFWKISQTLIEAFLFNFLKTVFRFKLIYNSSYRMHQSKKHRKSGMNFEQLLNKEWSIFTKAEYSELQAAFKKTDHRNGGIAFYDLINIIRNVGIPISELRKDQINKEIAHKEIRILNFQFLLNTAAALKKEREENYGGDVAEQNQYLDAFVALGGKTDKSGYVNKSALIEIVKRQFELSLDLENMIQGLQGDNLDYEVFCSIFDQDREKNEGRLASAASQRSLRSQASIGQLRIDQKDFQKFLSNYENDDA